MVVVEVVVERKQQKKDQLNRPKRTSVAPPDSTSCRPSSFLVGRWGVGIITWHYQS